MFGGSKRLNTLSHRRGSEGRAGGAVLGVYPWLSEAASTARQAGGVRQDWRGWKGPDPQRNAGHVGEMILLPTSQAPLKDFKQRMTPSMTIFIPCSPVTPPLHLLGLRKGCPFGHVTCFGQSQGSRSSMSLLDGCAKGPHPLSLPPRSSKHRTRPNLCRPPSAPEWP